MQEQTNLGWLLEGFKYDLELTVRPNTVKYYCGEIQRFLQWAQATYSIKDIRPITKKHIQAFFHHLATNHQPNGLEKEPAAIERLRWPYYRALRRFFEWAVNEGYLQSSPMKGIVLNAPQPAPN